MNKLSPKQLDTLTARNAFSLTQPEQERMLIDVCEVLEQIDILKSIDANGVEANTSTPCLVRDYCDTQVAQEYTRAKEGV